ncbi:MAG: amidohydrolase family protein [Deltaproteobacteria bacterium]|nr:amidohydrolase family protein [Deltaproteobacteria bacterium]
MGVDTVLIRNGSIIDGTGTPAFKGHVLIDGDSINAVFKENEEPLTADTVIDAADCAVAPGFIDMHSHADWLLTSDEHPQLMKIFLEQGITTIVGGNCGFSPAPITEESIRFLRESPLQSIISVPLDYEWRSMTEFLDRVSKTAPILNMAQLVGHSTVRFASSDTLRGAMKPDELNRCLDAVRRSFDEGARGLSFGLGYDQGMYSPLEEIESFCSVAAEAGRTVTVHLKALSKISPTYPLTYLKPHNVRALKEMLDIARVTGCRLQLSHFIFVGRKSWPAADTCLRMIDDARRDGVDVMIDAFPYTCGNTTINAVLPYWFLAMQGERYRSRWARLRLRAELEAGFRLVGFMYHDFQVMDAAVEGWEDLNGLRISEIARKWQKTPFDTLLTMSEVSDGAALMLLHTYSGEPGNEGPLESVLAHESCLFETDVVLRKSGYPNPSGLGTFPRVLGFYARDRKLMSMEDAVSRMTSKSAARFGLTDRGTIEPGKAADIVVFNPEKISDTPPLGPEPAGRPEGIKHLFINGAQVVRNGTYIDGARKGRVLRA